MVLGFDLNTFNLVRVSVFTHLNAHFSMIFYLPDKWFEFNRKLSLLCYPLLYCYLERWL